MSVVEKVVRQGDVTVIYCRGSLVIGKTDELRSAALAAIEDTGRLVIEVSQVPYMDSTGLGILAFLCVSARKVRGDLKLAAPCAQVAEALETTMLGTVFGIYSSVEDAVVAYSNATAATQKE